MDAASKRREIACVIIKSFREQQERQRSFVAKQLAVLNVRKNYVEARSASRAPPAGDKKSAKARFLAKAAAKRQLAKKGASAPKSAPQV